MNENTKFRLIYVIPPALITLIICIVEKNPVAIVSFLLIFPLWCLPILFFSDRISYYYSEKNKEQKFLKSMNISKKQWKRYSESEKTKYKSLHLRQEEIKRKIVDKRYPLSKSNLKHKKEAVIEEVEKEWEHFTLENRILHIEKVELELEEIAKVERNESFLRWKKLDELRKIELEKRKEKQKKEDKIKLEKEKVLAYRERELKRQRDEADRKLKIVQQQEIEEQKRIEEIKQKELLKQKKERDNQKHKEYIKQQLREKEKRKRLAAEAVEEMIESGELSANFSSNRNRETIPSHIKEVVWIRDKEKCVTCGSMENLEFDHIIPVSKGGSNSLNNIQLLCLKCNRSKSNRIM